MCRTEARGDARAAYRVHLKHQNEDPVYGGGFRAALAAARARTAAEVLEYVRLHGRLPKP